MLLTAAVAVALAAIAAASLFQQDASATDGNIKTGPQKMAIPAYFYATSPYWTQLQSGSPTVGIAVMNPSSGPGPRQNADYVNTVNMTKNAGVQTLGYVYTSYGSRSLRTVKSDIDKYYKWYGVNGIFFDEVSTDCSKASSYYKDLYNYVKGKGGTVVLNPGTQTNECYMSVGDTVVNFEGPYSTYASSYAEPSWVKNYNASRFWHLVYAASAEDMPKAVDSSKDRHAGYIYVTPDTLSNPWDTLPSDTYWSDELTKLAS